MSRARLVITAVVVEGRSQAEVARTYEVSPGWVSKLVARYRSEGEAAFEPRSRCPRPPSPAIWPRPAWLPRSPRRNRVRPTFASRPTNPEGARSAQEIVI